MPREMRDMRLTVGDFASPALEGRTNPCVMGCAHLYLGSLFVFGEGMGGSEGGRVEGRLAVSAVLAHFRNAEIDEPHERLAAALAHSADVLRTRSRSVSAFTDAWAQAVAVLVRKNRLFAVRCGDIRLFLVRNGQVRDLFADASVEAQPISDEKDETSALLGQGEMPHIEILPGEIPLEPGDRFLLANAPLSASVPLADIARYVASFVPAVAARRLVEAADQGPRHRAISVQIVQSGEAPTREFRAEEPIRPAVESSSGVAALLARSGRSVNEHRPPNPIWPSPSMDTDGLASSSRTRQFPSLENQRWSWLAGVAAVGLIAFGLSSWLSGGDSSEKAVPVAPEAIEVSDASISEFDASFWARMSVESIPNASEIRSWAGADAARRLAEARAVVAALEGDDLPIEPARTVSAQLADEEESIETGLPDDAPFEDVQRGMPSEAAAPGSHPPPKESADSELFAEEEVLGDLKGDKAAAPPIERKAVERPRSTAWSPKSLPRRIRGLDRIFRHKDTSRAGERLRNYIHRRHSRVSKVLASLDAYIARAPKERSIAVLKSALRYRPGPKSRRWMRRTLKMLRQ